MQVNTECTACDGTGLYSGMFERDGEAVICLCCNGTGCEVVEYIPFDKRRLRCDVKTVRHSSGRFRLPAAGKNPSGSVTYQEFLAGKRPSTVSDGVKAKTSQKAEKRTRK